MLRVVELASEPGVSVCGLKLAVVCGGKPLTLKATGSANPLADGVTVIVIVADCPGLTTAELDEALAEKSLSISFIAADVPPPGAALVTVRGIGPPVLVSLAGMATESSVALT